VAELAPDDAVRTDVTPGGPAPAALASAQDARMRAAASDVVAVHDLYLADRPVALRRELRRRGGPGTALIVAAQLDAIAGALVELVAAAPDRLLAEPGGEADWNVAQTAGHVADSRSGLAIAASLAAAGRFPADAPNVAPGVPGSSVVDRAALLRRLETSRRIVARAARGIAGHEADACPLDHPLVGRLRCGEWLLFAGVHDLMHLEQLRAIAARGAEVGAIAARATEAGT
jgi:hypothetical protein